MICRSRGAEQVRWGCTLDTMLTDALALAVKFIPFETYLLETSTHTNIAVTCWAGLIINAGMYQCVCSYICGYARERQS
jgi:hypothetical protein